MKLRKKNATRNPICESTRNYLEKNVARLFYEKTPPKKREFPTMNSEINLGHGGKNSYSEKVSKSIPAEIVAVYVSIQSLIPQISFVGVHSFFYWAIFCLCLLATPAYFFLLSEKSKPRKIHIFVSTVAFVVWAYAISGAALVPNLFDPSIASIFLIIFTFGVGFVPYKD